MNEFQNDLVDTQTPAFEVDFATQETRTFRHPAFAFIIERYGSSGMTVRPEYMVATEPQRADLLLLRHDQSTNQGQVLKRLWKHLPRRTLVEFKSISRPPRCGDWIKLSAFAGLYDAKRLSRSPHRRDLAMVLVTPSWTKTLERECKRMDWTRTPLGGGYYRIDGAPYASYVALIDEVAEAEQDPVLGAFAHDTVRKKLGPVPSDTWISIMAYFNQQGIDVRNDKDYEEMVRQFLGNLPPEIAGHVLKSFSPDMTHFVLENLPHDVTRQMLRELPPDVTQQMLRELPPEERLEGLSREERLKGLRPEERLEGLSQEEAILALPHELLRQLPATLIQSFSEETQVEIQRRLGS